MWSGWACRCLNKRLTSLCQSGCVAQVAPTPALLPSLAACGLRIRLHISPPQDALPELYRGHDALLFTSRYEAWGMPVLEAMASGLPTVASACLGVQAFARHDVNALLADPQARPGLWGWGCVTQQGQDREAGARRAVGLAQRLPWTCTALPGRAYRPPVLCTAPAVGWVVGLLLHGTHKPGG